MENILKVRTVSRENIELDLESDLIQVKKPAILFDIDNIESKFY